VGYGDIPATNFQEYFISVIWLLVGVGYYFFTIGNIAFLMVKYDESV
jgi:hypothetical protein